MYHDAKTIKLIVLIDFWRNKFKIINSTFRFNLSFYEQIHISSGNNVIRIAVTQQNYTPPNSEGSNNNVNKVVCS